VFKIKVMHEYMLSCRYMLLFCCRSEQIRISLVSYLLVLLKLNLLLTNVFTFKMMDVYICLVLDMLLFLYDKDEYKFCYILYDGFFEVPDDHACSCTCFDIVG